MKTSVKDVMTTRFHTLSPEQPLSDAVAMFQDATREEGRKVFGMMVTDEAGRLVGMLSMYDILLFVRPKHVQIWGVMEDVDLLGFVETACRKAKSIRVGDIMTTEMITITPDTNLLVVLDLMIKKHVRRIPVIEGDRILGIIYLSDLFYNMVDQLV